MNDAAVKAFVALIPACVLFAGSAIIFPRRKTMSSFFQLLGAAALVVVVVAHVLEALRVWPQIGWGSQNSVGYYLDLLCAILGITLFSLGYLIHAMDACFQKKSERV